MRACQVLASLLVATLPFCHCFNLPLPGGRFIRYNDGVLRIRLEEGDKLPSEIPPVGTQPSQTVLDSIQVRDTGTAKGYGAFAAATLKRNEFIGFYEGEVIQTREKLDEITATREAPSAVDYVMSMDGGVTFVDGYERAQDRTSFSPVHLNHADKGTPACNCVRLMEGAQIAFFTARKVLQGEELCFDYGRDYWIGREGMKL